MTISITSWSELKSQCPIDIEDICRYHNEFESYLPFCITINNLNKCKEDIIQAREKLDLMITFLIQSLHDKEMLKKKADRLLYSWLIDDLGRFMEELDSKEDMLIVQVDDPKGGGLVGIARLSTYLKHLTLAQEALIYSPLKKAIIEYKSISKEELKDMRSFLYILFQLIQTTLSVLGGMTRKKMGGSKRGMVQTLPTSWEALLSEQGQKAIEDNYKVETGSDFLDIPEELDGIKESSEAQELLTGGENDF